MDPKILFKSALEQATAMVKCVDSHHFKNSTPCTDWDCKTLVNHLLYELSWVPDVLAGKTIAEVGNKYDGDLIGKDHIGNWQKAADKALIAVNKAKLDKQIHLSYADKPTSYYLYEAGADLLIHSWDIAQSFQCSLILDDSLVQAVHDNIYPKRGSYVSSGLFGKPLEVAKTARLQTKLLAMLGRREPSL